MSKTDDGSDEPDRDAATIDEAREPEPQDGDGDSVTFQDEYEQAFGAPPAITHVMDDDGLPKPLIDDVLEDAHVPPFLPEKNQICVADLRSFVIRCEPWDHVIATVEPTRVQRMPSGAYAAKLGDLLIASGGKWMPSAEAGEKLRLSLTRQPKLRENARTAIGVIVGMVLLITMNELGVARAVAITSSIVCSLVISIALGFVFRHKLDPKLVENREIVRESAPFLFEALIEGNGEELLEVEPVRPACEHYLAQLEPATGAMARALKYGSMHRYCTAKRSTAGAFFGLKDEAMAACSMRSPQEPTTLDIIDRFDVELAEKSRNRVGLSMFNIQDEGKPDADLAAFKEAQAEVLRGQTEKKE